MTVEVPLNDEVTTGGYILTFVPKVPLSAILSIQTPKTISILGYTVSLDEWTKDEAAKTVKARIYVGATPTGTTGGGFMGVLNTSNLSGIAQPVQTPVQPVIAPAVIIAIAVGVMALAGLTLTMLSLSKVEKIVESPGVNVALIAVGIIALVILWKQFRNAT
jgi:hypothetical protein